MDTVDETRFKFEVTMENIHLNDLKAPWRKLKILKNESDYLSSQFDEYFDAVDTIDNFNDAASDDVRSRITAALD